MNPSEMRKKTEAKFLHSRQHGEDKESHQFRVGWSDWENRVSNDLSDGWQSEESHTMGAEFDGRPLGSLNAELYTILFSCLNTGTQSRWRGRDESTVCVCVLPLCRCWCLALVRPQGKFRNYCGWTMYKAECVRARQRHRVVQRDNVHDVSISTGPLEMHGPNRSSPTGTTAHMTNIHTHTHTLLHFLASLWGD